MSDSDTLRGGPDRRSVKSSRNRLPDEVVTFAVRMHVRRGLSLRQVQALLRSRGITASHEAVRTWAAVPLRRHQALPLAPSAEWNVSTRAVVVRGELAYLSIAETADGDVLDVLLQSRRDDAEALRQLRRGLAEQEGLASASPRETTHHDLPKPPSASPVRVLRDNRSKITAGTKRWSPNWRRGHQRAG